MKIKLGVLAMLLGWFCSGGPHARADSPALVLALEAQVNALESEGTALRGLGIAWSDLIQRFYAQRGYLPAGFVVVNVPGFEAYLVRNNAVAWSARVQVGRPVRRTPIFRSTLSYVVFNPTWTVPPSIFKHDILPEARKSAKAISRRGLKVYDRAGRELDPAKIRWKTVRVGSMPYVLRQDAGPGNALGRVKLMFPNSYSVYLHDTPAQDLFEAGDRSLSSGCVRVERPLELARLVLNDSTKWSAAEIEQVVRSQRTLNVNLPQKLPVLLAYWTAWVDREHRLNFRADVYQRDPLWSKQLAAGFVVRKRPLSEVGSEPLEVAAQAVR